MELTSQPEPEVLTDAERQQVAVRLQQAVGAGMCTLEEFTARVDIAYAAKSREQLAEATRELPLVPAAGARRSVKWLVGIFGDAEQSGPWRADNEVNAVTVFGDVSIDLRGLYVEREEVVIRSWGLFGDTHVIVPEGVEVEVSGLCLFGDRKLDIAPVPRRAGTPLVRVVAFSVFGDVLVSNDKPSARWRDVLRRIVDRPALPPPS